MWARDKVITCKAAQTVVHYCDEELAIRGKDPAEAFFAAKHRDLAAIRAEENLEIGAEINAGGSRDNVPNIEKIGIAFGRLEWDEVRPAVDIGFEVAEFAAATDVNAAGGIDSQGTNSGAGSEANETPEDPVEFEDAVGVAEIHNAARILGDGPILRVG